MSWSDCSGLRGVYSKPGEGSCTSGGRTTDIRLGNFLREGLRPSSPTEKKGKVNWPFKTRTRWNWIPFFDDSMNYRGEISVKVLKQRRHLMLKELCRDILSRFSDV